jgi:predicted nucleic acid-binding protein
MRCTDTDDQKFIDLALAHGARWLLSRDRAVLKLGRRTRVLGLEVLTPEIWLGAFSAGEAR